MKRSLQPKLTLQGDGSESRGHRESLPSMPAEEAGAANSIPGKRDWVKLTAENVGRYVLGEDCIRVVHCLSNSRGGLGDDSETIELHPRFGPAVDAIFNAYPKAVCVEHLPDISPPDQVDLVRSLFRAGIVMVANDE
mmetsp:Transcript_36054/g.58308  ORF Transcript_36054/g.58308 Transcript_36054/m.58308 type:complete len:137 (+) Transcript_36054:85-495(+)